MQRFCKLAAAHKNDAFGMTQRHGISLLVKRTLQGIEQLVIPSSHGLRQMLMQELHKTAIAGHLGTRELTASLF